MSEVTRGRVDNETIVKVDIEHIDMYKVGSYIQIRDIAIRNRNIREYD